MNSNATHRCSSGLGADRESSCGLVCLLGIAGLGLTDGDGGFGSGTAEFLLSTVVGMGALTDIGKMSRSCADCLLCRLSLLSPAGGGPRVFWNSARMTRDSCLMALANPFLASSQEFH